MAATVDIGTLIVRSANIREGRPRIAGTGVSVHRIAREYKKGCSPEEILAQIPHLPLAGIYAALAYYHANREEIEEDIARDDAIADELEQKHARRPAPVP
jgi:uncharacterized protein (DUF433 family)